MIRALQECKFAGKIYPAGSVVPDSAVDKRTFNALVDMGVIAVEETPPDLPAPPKPKAKKQTPKPKVDDLKFDEEN